MIKLKDILNEAIGGIVSLRPINNPFLIRDKAPWEKGYKINESPAEDDAKEAEQLKKPLTNAIAEIARSMDSINKKLSSFNSPGLKHAFTDALRIALKRQGKFDERAAYKRFNDYYDR